MNDSPVDCQNTSVTEPQREGRAIADGGVGGASGIGAIKEKYINMKQESNHATNFERSQKTLSATPWINKLVSQASQVEEKCFRSKRPNFAKQKRILPVSRASRCSLQSASGAGAGTGGGKRQNKRPEAIASGFLFWLPLLDSNQRHPD